MQRRILKNIYRSLFESHLHFGSIVWGCAKQSYIKKKLEIQQEKPVRHIFNLKLNSHTAEVFRDLEVLQINDHSPKWVYFCSKLQNNKLPPSFRNSLSPVSDQGPRRTRDDDYNFSLTCQISALTWSHIFYQNTKLSVRRRAVSLVTIESRLVLLYCTINMWSIFQFSISPAWAILCRTLW